jgi:hypothetical protein
MPRRLAIAALACGVISLGSGCAVNRMSASAAPDSGLADARTFYVVLENGDDRGIQNLIRDNLARRGYQASAGAEGAKPADADVLVTYVDHWMWDMSMYMLELTITFRNPSNNFPMATGNSYHTSISRKSPEEMVDEVLGNIFAKAKETKQ